MDTVLDTGTAGWTQCWIQEQSVGYGNTGMDTVPDIGLVGWTWCQVWEVQDGQGDGYGNSGMGAVSIQE